MQKLVGNGRARNLKALFFVDIANQRGERIQNIGTIWESTFRCSCLDNIDYLIVKKAEKKLAEHCQQKKELVEILSKRTR